MSETRFREDIQGLRAIAVLSVVITHAFPKYLTGGYVGVDIFFVISGYLISRIVVRDIETQAFSITSFYRRRIRRIFPALAVVLLSTLAVGWLLLAPIAYRELARTTISTLLFVSNFHFLKLTGYFDGAAELKPLLHMWSLAVEEQFYIFFPPLMALIWPRTSRSKGSALIFFAMLASVAIAELYRNVSPDGAYFMLPSRACELLLGAIWGVGRFKPLPSEHLRTVFSLTGLALMSISIVVFTPLTPFPGIAAMLPCLGAVLVIYAGEGAPSLGGRLISSRPITYIGAISYSYYLWHWPVLVFLRISTTADLSLGVGLLGIVVSGGFASLSYHFIEQPFLRPPARHLSFFKLAVAQTCIIGGIALGISLLQGVPQRFSPAASTLLATSNDYNPRRNKGCHYNPKTPLTPYSASCVFGYSGATPDTAVWADSEGAELVVYLGERAAHERRSVRELTSSGCPPAADFDLPHQANCKAMNKQTLKALISDQSINTVVLAANGEAYKGLTGFQKGLANSVRALVAAHKRVIILAQVPIMSFDPPAKAGLLASFGQPIAKLGRPRDDALRMSSGYDKFVNGIAYQLGAEAYDPKQRLCDQTTCQAYERGTGVLYFDPEHLGVSGAAFAYSPLADTIYSLDRSSERRPPRSEM